jgi:hypothetical protein
VARALFCYFLSTACIDERIPLLQYTATYRNDGAPRVGFLRVGVCIMPKGLKRYYGRGHLHFLTFSCYRRLPLLNTMRARNLMPFFKRVDNEQDLGYALGSCRDHGPNLHRCLRRRWREKQQRKN